MNRRLQEMSRSESDTIESVENANEEAFVNIVESGQIGYRLADEIRILRETLLTTKQEKRILLISNENLEDALEKASKNVFFLKSKLADLQHLTQVYSTDLATKDQDLKRINEGTMQFKKNLAAEKKKNKLLVVELERSLEDEVALRSYCKRLEADNISLKKKLCAAEEILRIEVEERWKCQQFIDTALRSQLILQKKLETIVYYCDKDVDMSAVSILDVSPDYLESLLRDVRSELSVAGAPVAGSSVGFRGKFDFAVLDHKQHNIDHQTNQYLNNIRSHVAKLRKAHCKTRKYMRSLLEVIRTYEELPSGPGGSEHAQPHTTSTGSGRRSFSLHEDMFQDQTEDYQDHHQQLHEKQYHHHYPQHALRHTTATGCGGGPPAVSTSASVESATGVSAANNRNSNSRNPSDSEYAHNRNSNDSDIDDSYSHERTLAMLEQIQASLRSRDHHTSKNTKV